MIEGLLAKAFFIYVLFLSAPVVMTLLRVYFVAQKKEKERLERQAEKELKKKHNNKETIEERVDRLEVYNKEVLPYYEAGRDLFKFLMQNGTLKKPQIDELKTLLNWSIGDYKQRYKSYKFKNDAHEIYTKMKSTKIDKRQWCSIIRYLQSCE